MKSKDQSKRLRFSREELRTVILFWGFWSAYALLSTFLIVALLTGWPEFLHAPAPSTGP